jgi:hypothetical protein
MTSDEMVTVLKLISTATADQVKQIFDAGNRRMKEARAQESAEAAATLQVGDAVITQNLKPKYMCGLRAIITSREPNAKFGVEVIQEDRWQLGRYSANFVVGAAALAKREVAA